MNLNPDRITKLLGGRRRKHSQIMTPEGVTLTVDIAGRGERFCAFVLDMLVWLLAVIVMLIFLVYVLSNINIVTVNVFFTLVLFAGFLFRNLYFIYFELTCRGMTPGKKIFRIKVIDRKGNALRPAAIVARNLTREIEFFIPLQMLLQALVMMVAGTSTEFWQNLTMLGWMLLLAALPMFNRHHMRAGDFIAGTLVIALPATRLLPDVATTKNIGRSFEFSHEQLQIYGAFELQVLEEILRRPSGPATVQLQIRTAENIVRRIGYKEKMKFADVPDFLNAFYIAQRAELERGQLFGRYREDKNSGVQQIGKSSSG